MTALLDAVPAAHLELPGNDPVARKRMGDLLTALDGAPRSVRTLAAAVALPPGTAHRHLKRLVSAGLALYEPGEGYTTAQSVDLDLERAAAVARRERVAARRLQDELAAPRCNCTSNASYFDEGTRWCVMCGRTR